MFQSGPRLATTSTTPWTLLGCDPASSRGASAAGGFAGGTLLAPPGITGSARTMTGSCSELEMMGWLTIDLPCSPRETPSRRSCSMAGSDSCTPERAPVLLVSTTLT